MQFKEENTITYVDLFIETNLDFEYVPNTLCLTGVSFENRQYLIPQLITGQLIFFQRDPKNLYDQYAIKVLVKFNNEITQIGCIPKPIARILAPEIDSGIKWGGEIIKITGGNDKNYGIVIKLFYNV